MEKQQIEHPRIADANPINPAYYKGERKAGN